MVVEETKQSNTISRQSEGYVFGCVGPRGAGKNILGTMYVLEYLNDPNFGPDRTYTNWPVEGVKRLDLKLFLDMKVAERDQENGTHEYPYWDCFIGWDEPHRTVDMRRSSSKTNLDGCEVFDQSRKLGIRLFWCDKPHRVDLRVRENCDVIIEAKNDPRHECFVYRYTDPDKPNKMQRVISYREASEWWNKYYTRWLIKSSYEVKEKYVRGGGQRAISSEVVKTTTPNPEDNHLDSSTKSTPLPHDVIPPKKPRMTRERGMINDEIGKVYQRTTASMFSHGEYKDYIVENNEDEGPDIIIKTQDGTPLRVISVKSYSFPPMDKPLHRSMMVEGKRVEWREGNRVYDIKLEDLSPELEYATHHKVNCDFIIWNITNGNYERCTLDVNKVYSDGGLSISLKDHPRLQ